MTRFALPRWSMLAALLGGACGGPTPAATRAERLPFDLDATRRLIAQQNERYAKAHVAGTYVVTYGPAPVTERGKYLNVWTQVNGSWKIKANMWNTDAPAPTPN